MKQDWHTRKRLRNVETLETSVRIALDIRDTLWGKKESIKHKITARGLSSEQLFMSVFAGCGELGSC